MILPSTILEAAPSTGAAVTGLLLGGAVFLVAIVIAVIAFKILKRSLKMAFRVVVVVMILIVFALGALGVFVYNFVQGQQEPKPRPTPRQTR